MKNEQRFKRKCECLVHQINRKLLIFVSDIRYREYLHNVEYEGEICYCINKSERRLDCSNIAICRYKNRVQVGMVLATRNDITNLQKNTINRILRTNAQYRKLKSGYTEIIFNVNPHKM